MKSLLLTFKAKLNRAALPFSRIASVFNIGPEELFGPTLLASSAGTLKPRAMSVKAFC